MIFGGIQICGLLGMSSTSVLLNHEGNSKLTFGLKNQLNSTIKRNNITPYESIINSSMKSILNSSSKSVSNSSGKLVHINRSGQQNDDSGEMKKNLNGYRSPNVTLSINKPIMDNLTNTMNQEERLSMKNRLLDDMISNNRREQQVSLSGKIETDYQGRLARSYIKTRGIASDQIAAYENFLDVQVPQILAHRVIRMDDDTHVAFINHRYTLPYIEDINGKGRVMFPQTAREEYRTYSTTLRVDLEHRRNDTGELVYDPRGRSRISDVEIAKIPVMVGSSKDNIVVHQIDKDRHKLLQMGECPFDPKGYFIIKGGVEKMVLIQECLRAMRPMITKIKKDYVCLITCLTIIGSIIVKLSYDKKCRSINIFLHVFQGKESNVPVFQIFRVLGMTNTDEIVDYILQFVRDEVKSKVRMHLQGSIKQVNSISDDFTTIYLNSMFVSNKKKRKLLKGYDMVLHVYNSIRDALFPHIGSRPAQNREEYDKIIESKKMLLALMVARYAEFLAGVREADNRDSWPNKRLILAGPKIKQLFRTLFDRMVDNVRNNISDRSKVKQPTLESVRRNISPATITDDIVNSFTSDQWGASKRTRKANVTDTVDRGNSPISAPDQYLRINAPTNRRATQVEARSIQPDQHGYIDPVATPSSDACGLVKNKAIGCEVSIKRDDLIVFEYLNISGMVHNKRSVGHSDLCMLNARPLGWCDGKTTRLMLLKRRRSHEIDHDVALVYKPKDKEFNIHTDGGRVMKAFIINDNNGVPLIFKPGMIDLSFDRLCELGIIEWLDIWEAMNHFSIAYSISLIKKIIEQQNILTYRLKLLQMKKLRSNDRTSAVIQRQIETISLELTRLNRKKYTHVDIDPTLSLGAAASIIPWIDRNQGPRNSFQSSMSRHAMGQNHSNYNLHFPTTGKYLTYPQQSIAATQMQAQFGLDDLPAGHNVVVAVCTDPDNEEDAVTVKKEALERGLFNYQVVHSYSTIVRNPIKISNGEIVEQLTASGLPFQRHQKEDYQHIGDNGIAKVGSVVKPGDCLICKVKIVKCTTKGANSKVKFHRKDSSVYVDLWESGIVDYVKVTRNSNNEQIIRVRVAKSGRPIVGDKVATRQGQKSTIGRILPEKDMPYTATGIVPDIILNPHAIPKRMTVATPIEILTSKYAAMSGTRVNATPFREFPIDTYRNMLSMLYGFPDSGEEKLYFFSGEKVLNCSLMIGLSYYQLLRHQVLSKYQFRGEGTRHLLTRLPPQGRKKAGGIRFGEQELQGILGHGAVNMLRDRSLYTCDAHTVVICRSCNNVAITDIARDMILCRVCGGTEFGTCVQAYTLTLMSNYCATVGIKILPSYALTNKESSAINDSTSINGKLSDDICDQPLDNIDDLLIENDSNDDIFVDEILDTDDDYSDTDF